MSYKNSNLYASRVFSEHPIGLWSLDEDYYFISLLGESEKKITTSDWTISNGQYSTSTQIFPKNEPIFGGYTSKIFLPLSSSAQSIEVLGPDIVYSEKIDEKKGSICFALHVYSEASHIESYDIGFIINSVEYYTNHLIYSENSWQKISHTEDIFGEYNIKPFIRINYTAEVVPGINTSAFFINGPSVGQWSEPYNSKYNGIITEALPEYISNVIPNYPNVVNGLPLDPYGLNSSDNGYIIQEGKRLLVEKSGIPMVYGSKNNYSILSKNPLNVFSSTVSGGLFSEDDFVDGTIDSLYSDTSFSNYVDGGNPSYTAEDIVIPSIIFPGKGFLNQSGKLSPLTSEFWIRINPELSVEKRIFGPATSNDGIYVSSNNIIVKVDKYVKSYFISQWYRPMLIHFGQISNEIFLMINGEKVISINVDVSSLSNLPDYLEDYLCFYGDDDISIFDIDCFSIFPYAISEQVAKRRFVYGQGVDDQENIVENINGEIYSIDFPFSGYNSTMSYPDRAQWSSGYYNNLNADQSGISTMDYNLPEIVFTSLSSSVSSDTYSTTAMDNFFLDNFNIQDENYPFISMLPNSNYSSIFPSLYFSKVNQLANPAKSIYGVFIASSNVDDEQTILYMSDNNNENYFKTVISSGSLQYIYNDTVVHNVTISSGEAFSVGVDFEKISKYYPSIFGNFFSNLDTVSLNIAGYQQSKFLGKMFSFTINNSFYTDKDSLIPINGISNKAFGADKYGYIGSYTLIPKLSNDSMYLDIATAGYWETSIPLSYFGKYVIDSKGNKIYDLDIVQFNIDIPGTSFIIEDSKSINLQESFLVKPYITLQSNKDAGSIPYTAYEQVEKISEENKILNFDEETDLDITKFLVSDGTIIFPPKSTGSFLDYYVGIHIEIISKGVNTGETKVKKMSFSSLAFDESQFYGISTQSGKKIYPIAKTFDQYVYDARIPVVINTETSPYLFITRRSGISVADYGRGDGLTRGISFPINSELNSDFVLSGIQLFLMFNKERTFSNAELMGRIIYSEISLDIVLEPEFDGKRARIKILESSSQLEQTGFKMFLNGKYVNQVFIKPLEWNLLTISFEDGIRRPSLPPKDIDLSSKNAQFEIYSGISVDNVVAFKKSNQILSIAESFNEWVDILRSLDQYGNIDEEFAWQYWDALEAGTATWEDVYNYQTINLSRVSVDGERIYNTYTGLSFAIANDSSMLNVNYDSFRVLNDADWTTFELKPT